MAETLHATCVAYHGRAVVLTGASGQGKSTLGLQLIALGCDLIADDRTILTVAGGKLTARCPETLQGIIEARGIGLVRAVSQLSAEVALVVDLNQRETARMPPPREITLLGCTLPLIWRSDGPQFVPAILQILKSGWSER
ncbi:HPr kinase/phosphorylase [Yoonia sp.]|uniref:HPr kinase/phosphorylase n=1 Tax=Yoonia sp. TaxID=2212373 RepID=UPI0035C84E70